MRRIAILTGLLCCLFCLQAHADEHQDIYAFDLSALEYPPFSLDGYLELRPSLLWLDQDSLIYRLTFFEQDEPNRRARWLTRLQLEGTYKNKALNMYVRTNSDLLREGGCWDHLTSLHEAYMRWSPDRSFSLEIGKKVMRWGTGYSWNPVGFIARPKDPDEPDLPREGFFLLSADRVRSLPGALQTLGVSLVLIPVAGDLGSDFGEENGLNIAGKIYLLYRDTDLDFMALTGPSQPTRYGMDFARNLRPNLEVHGEYSHTPREERARVTEQGEVITTQSSVHRMLLGLRYLTVNDITYIVEYQHNGDGFSESEIKDFYRLIETAEAVYEETEDISLLQYARQLNRELFSSRPLGRRYLYLRVSQKEPRNLLYFTPAFTLQCNLADRSFSLVPEAIYTGYTNWELRMRVFLLFGNEKTEFGEKAAKGRLELTARHFF